MQAGQKRKIGVVVVAPVLLLVLALGWGSQQVAASKIPAPGEIAAIAQAQIRLAQDELVSDDAGVVEPSPISTVNGVVDARWADNVVVTVGDDVFRFESNGLPDHELPNPFLALQGRAYAPAVAWSDFTELDRSVELVESPIDQTITLNPVLADTPNEVPAGLIGVLINGAQLYHDGVVVDDVQHDPNQAGFVDLCNGHPTGAESDGSGAANYHYHGVPTCTTDSVDVEGRHSSMIGVLIDGFPIYGSNDVDGVAVTAQMLDECSGHFGPTPEFPRVIYHYHLLDELSADPIPCLHGELPDPPSTLPLQSRNGE